MKKIKFLGFSLIILIGFGLNVEIALAKDVMLECNYISEAYSLAGYPGATVKCEVYSDYSHMCYVTHKKEKNNEEEILNWSEKDSSFTGFSSQEYVREKNACPNYLYLRLGSGNDGYKVYGAESTDMIDKFYDKFNVDAAEPKEQMLWHTAVVEGYNYSDEEQQQFNSNVDVFTKGITDSYKAFDFDKCIAEGGAIAGKTTYYCEEKLNYMGTLVRSSEEEINQMIDVGKVKETDDSVIKFREAVTNAKATIESGAKRINEYGTNPDDDIVIDPSTGKPISCADFVTDEGVNLISELFNIIMIIGPILALVLGGVDFAKATLASDDNALKKAGTNFGKRIAAAILLFLLPLIINLVLGVAFGAGVFGTMENVPEVCLTQK